MQGAWSCQFLTRVLEGPFAEVVYNPQSMGQAVPFIQVKAFLRDLAAPEGSQEKQAQLAGTWTSQQCSLDFYIIKRIQLSDLAASQKNLSPCLLP